MSVTLPAYYRELYQAMENVMRERDRDVPGALGYMHVYPEAILSNFWPGWATTATTDDVRTFVAFMRDGIRTRGGQL